MSIRIVPTNADPSRVDILDRVAKGYVQVLGEAVDAACVACGARIPIDPDGQPSDARSLVQAVYRYGTVDGYSLVHRDHLVCERMRDEVG